MKKTSLGYFGHWRRLALSTFLWAALGTSAPASDHGDMPELAVLGRQDARITDLYAFVRNGDRLILALCLNPAIPPNATSYHFSSDLLLTINIDDRSPVSFLDPEANRVMGGTILQPEKIKDRIRLEIQFDEQSQPRVKSKGLSSRTLRHVQIFSGLCDDPFIRGPRQNRNVAAVVLSLPIKELALKQSTLLIWATSEVSETEGHIADHVGRALRSMFPENDSMNNMEPHLQARRLGLVPDVMIFNTSLPALYPNGRDLADDVVDLVGDPRILQNDQPFPSENDVPFLPSFPYLAPPHPAP